MNVLAAAALVAAEKPLTPENVRPGWLALGVVVLLGVATFLLVRSFIKHTKRAGQRWDGESSDEPAAGRPGADRS